MASLNKVMLIGNLGRDPETRYTPEGTAVSTVSIATSSTWKDKEGKKQEKTEWHRCVFWGKLAEIAEEYLAKGALIYVEGRLTTRKWQDKDGADKYTTEVVCSALTFLGSRDSDNGEGTTPPGDSTPAPGDAKPAAGKSAKGGKKKAKAGETHTADDDIPF
jgi:single-strand DNA-binding protein